MKKLFILAAALFLTGCAAGEISVPQAPVSEQPAAAGTGSAASTGAQAAETTASTGSQASIAPDSASGVVVASPSASPVRPRGPRRDNSFFGEITSVSQGIGSYKVVGALRGDFTKISVVWRHDDGPGDEPYFLKKYKPEARVFEYFIAPKFKTILPGKNTYVFTGYKADGTTEAKEFSFVENAVVSAGKHCVLDVCIDDSKPFSMSGTAFVQTIATGESEDDESTEISVDSIRQTARLQKDRTMFNQTTKVFRAGNFLIHINETSSCAGNSFRQETYDLSGKPVKDAGAALGAPATLTVGNRTFRLKDLNAENATYVYGTLQPDARIDETFSPSDAGLGKTLLANAQKTGFLPKRYLLTFSGAAGITLPYVIDGAQPEQVMKLAVGAADMDAQGNIVSAKLTNDILAPYVTNRGLVKDEVTSYGGTITSSSGQTLPLFRLEKFTDDGYWLMYPAKGYSFQSFAEMCKPVVYAYGAAGTDLRVGVDLLGKGFFTKLIPQFSMGTAWDSVLDGRGGVTVAGKAFPYLYYSAKVADYRPNTVGWLVPGEDASAFFTDKLGKMNLKENEIRDFVDFWKDQFRPGAHYFVSFKYDDEMDGIAALSFSRAPSRVNRVLLDAREMALTPDNERYLPSRVGDRLDAKLLRKFERGGDLDVLEWGGVFLDEGKLTVR